MTLVITAHSNRQISERLFISPSTTKFHIRNILRKMDVSNRQKMREEELRHIAG